MKNISKPIIYPKLSYHLMNVLFTVHNQLGNELQEKIYQRSVADELAQRNIVFKREVYIPIIDHNGQQGKCFLDFVIDSSIALELKANPTIYRKDIRQLLVYLAVTNLRLGIIANFRTIRLTYQRVVNARWADSRIREPFVKTDTQFVIKQKEQNV